MRYFLSGLPEGTRPPPKRTYGPRCAPMVWLRYQGPNILRLSSRPDRRNHAGMSALTSRRDPDAHHKTWLIHHGDVHIGTIRMRAGVPGSVDQWGMDLRLLSSLALRSERGWHGHEL